MGAGTRVAGGSAEARTLIRGARVFDGTRTLGLADVLVEGGRITAVGQCDAARSGAASIVDGSGATLLPGLIDAHVHTPAAPERAERALRQSLAAGVTTVLCMGTHPEVAGELKTQAALRYDLADLRSSGWCATVPGGHPTEWAQAYYPTLSGADDAARFIQRRVDEGMDYIKNRYRGLGRSALPAIAREL